MMRSLLRAGIVVIGCVCIAQSAPAQSTFGPPALDVPSIPMSPGVGGGSSLNPLSIIESASELLPNSRPQGDAPAPISGSDSRPRSTPGKSGGLSTSVNILVVLTVISLAPSIMLMTTCFVRMLVVLGLLRQALGTQSIPPPQVITALALFMTLLVMTPTIQRINDEAIKPYRAGQVQDYDELWNRAKQPMRDFMFAQIEATGNWSSLYMVLEQRGIDTSRPESLTRADVDMVSLVPAFMLSELKTAFLMGFKVYLPFLVIDMIISTMLISMSMMMVPPVLVSLPFKLLLFVLVDGWTLVVGGLMSSFAPASPEVALLVPAATDSLCVGGPTLLEACRGVRAVAVC